jgi:hypothetical protein
MHHVHQDAQRARRRHSVEGGERYEHDHNVELVAIVQVYGARPGVTIEVWPAQAAHGAHAGLEQ